MCCFLKTISLPKSQYLYVDISVDFAVYMLLSCVGWNSHYNPENNSCYVRNCMRCFFNDIFSFSESLSVWQSVWGSCGRHVWRLLLILFPWQQLNVNQTIHQHLSELLLPSLKDKSSVTSLTAAAITFTLGKGHIFRASTPSTLMLMTQVRL